MRERRAGSKTQPFGTPSPRKGGSRALTAGRLPEHLPFLRFFFPFLPEATATSALASYPFLSLEGQAEPSCCLFTVPTLPVLHSLPACDLWELTVPALDSDPSGEALSIQGPLLRRTGARCLSVAERASCVTRGPAHLSIHAPSVISKRMRTRPPQGQGPKATGFPSSFSGRLVPRSAPAWFNNEINSL